MNSFRPGHIGNRHPQLRLTKSSSQNDAGSGSMSSYGGQNSNSSRSGSGMLTARELTGAPLISYAHGRSRKLRRARTLQPGQEYMPVVSEQSRDNFSEKNLHKYYLGQNLYQKENRNRDKTFIQDFYQNPSFGQRSSITNGRQKQLKSRVEKSCLSEKESFDFSDAYSVTSDESDNFKPRIIKPRRRRKKEKKRHTVGGKIVSQEHEDVCLGSENQWLPQGLLSAESESCGDSVRSESDQEVSSSSSSSSVKSHRKLAATLSVPTFSSYTSFSEISSGSIGSDYFSQVSPRSFSSVGSDHDHERDHGELSAGGDHNSDDTSPSGNSDNDSGHHSLLSATKSYNHPSTNSCSFFRSPKLDIKMDKNKSSEKTRLRKTNSWAYPGNMNNSNMAQFSLFSTATNNDPLSGIRKHLSKIDLNEEEKK